MSVSSGLGGDIETQGHSVRRAVVAVGVGNAIEWYDFAIYGSFAAAIGLTFFPHSDSATRLLLAFAVYGTALLVRPLGALTFGRMGDRRGRRPAMAAVVLLMAGATAAVALLPGYLAIGVAAPVLLVLLRALQGLAAGGELGVSSVFMFEHAPAGRRGAIGSLQVATLSLGMAAGMAVAAVLIDVDDGAAVRAGWWRIAFIAALPLGLIGWYVRVRVNETAEYLGVVVQPGQRPWRRLLRESRAHLWRGFVIMGTGSLAYNTFFIFLPNHFLLSQGGEARTTWLVTAGGLVVAAVAAVVLGSLSDRYGRRPIVAGSALLLATLAAPLSLLAGQSLGLLFIAQSLIGIGIGGILSVALIAEAFPVEMRSTGVAMTAGLATALIGGTAPAIDQLLVLKVGLEIGPGPYLAVVAVVAALAIWHWEERR